MSSETWYMVDLWDNVKAVEVERSTASCVWINGRRRAKRNTYFPTRKDAFEHFRAEITNLIEMYRRGLAHAETRLKKLLIQESEQ